MRDTSEKETNMSSIGNITGTGTSDLTSLIQNLLERSQSTQSNSTSESSSSETTSTNGQGIDGLKTKLDAAIADALKNQDKSSSADEIMQAIKSAIDSTMKANGVNPEDMQPPQMSGSSNGTQPPMPQGGQGSNSDPLMSKIEQLLQENGFDVEKFKSELASKATEQSGASMLQLFNNVISSQGVNEQA
jgi:hypothetical protein